MMWIYMYLFNNQNEKKKKKRIGNRDFSSRMEDSRFALWTIRMITIEIIVICMYEVYDPGRPPAKKVCCTSFNRA